MSQFTVHTLQLCLVLDIAELEMQRGICWHYEGAGERHLKMVLSLLLRV